MKPYAKLARADFEQFPIWEWLPEAGTVDLTDPADSIDESFVRPTALTEIPRGPFVQFIVAASITLKSEELMPGIAEVTIGGDAVSIQPVVVFLLDRHLPIPGVETNRLLTRYTIFMDNCPVGWRLAVPVEGESVVRTGAIKHGDMKEIVAAGLQALLALKGLRRK